MTGVPVAGPEDEVPYLYLYEKRPDSRTKQSLFAEWRYAFDRDSFALNFRFMDDDWGVQSQTAEARYRWNINDRSYLEPHLRWYTQSAADFYRTVLFDGRCAARVRDGRLPARRPRRLHRRREVRPAHRPRRVLGAARVLPAVGHRVAGLGGR